MRLTCVLTVRLAENSRSRDLGVGEPAGDEPQHLDARARSAPRAAPGDPARRAARRTNSSISRRVIAGASSASPRRDRADRLDELLGRRVLEQEAARARLHRVVDVLVEVEGGEHRARAAAASGAEQLGASPRSRRARACGRPSARRRGCSRAASSTASRAVRGLADDLDVGLGVEDHPRSPPRTSAWSSAIRTRITRAPLVGSVRGRAKPPLGRGPALELAAVAARRARASRRARGPPPSPCAVGAGRRRRSRARARSSP